MRATWTWLVIMLLSCAGPAHAILPTVSETAPSQSPAQSPVERNIEADVAPGSDSRIAERIRGFYGVIDAFSSITVKVEQGVVTLDGTVATQAEIDEAESLARQVAGVVTVQNNLRRNVSIKENLGPFASLSDKFNEFVRLLPLMGAAVLVAGAIGLLGYLIAGMGRFWRKVSPNIFLAELIASAIRFVFVIGGLVIALDMLGASALLGAVLGGAGVIGIALGFAMRDTVENYVASLMLSLRQPFRANDLVLINDMEGRIIRLTSRATIMMTLDGNHLRIPNSAVFKAVILNYTTNPQRRFDFELGIDADDDPNAARHLGREMLKTLPFVLYNPAPEGRVTKVGDSSIVIQYLGWIDQREADWYKARSRAIAAVKTALEAAGFGLPEPIYRLRFDDRTAPLPIARVGQSDAALPASEPAAHSDSAAEDVHDVAPEDEISRMVDAERALKPDEHDLLDSNKPVE
ncbi:MAG: mechanosensitive ion channel family protein [Pontixanthobacter sp.]